MGEEIRDAVFLKLGALNLFESARKVKTVNPDIRVKLIAMGHQGVRDAEFSDFQPVRPAFEVFDFPDHCVGGTLLQLGLNEKFEIPVAAIAREDGSMRWWPK